MTIFTLNSIARQGDFKITLFYAPGGMLDHSVNRLRSLGVRVESIIGFVRGINPIRDISAGMRLAAAIREFRAD